MKLIFMRYDETKSKNTYLGIKGLSFYDVQNVIKILKNLIPLEKEIYDKFRGLIYNRKKL